MWPGRAADHSPPSSGRVELYLYPPTGLHRACNGITLPLQNTEGRDIERVLTHYSGMSSENECVKITVAPHNEIRTWYFMNIKHEEDKCCVYRRCQHPRLYSVDGRKVGNRFPSDMASYRRRIEHANVS